MVQPIGKAADLLCQFFCQGIADLFESRAIMGRAPPGVPQEEFGRCYDQMNAVTVNADSPGAAGGDISLPSFHKGGLMTDV
ncbi:hypothetical protein J3458_004417 [Metarhizium acridum]|uniref:uncharacterized protein n=1 Tax=Metarhizium acridum TaxID=92637 RepID=UPI001C6C6E73|nr:hypothetical protein J3458_004417 [Metarhizium acridum]